MPARSLPNDPSLEQLKKHAKTLQRAVRAGIPQALDLVGEFHPGLGALTAGAARFSRADAQLVIARHYGFGSWARLRAHLEVVARYSRAPHRQAVGGPVTGEAKLADESLRLACLTHGDDDPARWRQADALLRAHPGLEASTSRLRWAMSRRRAPPAPESRLPLPVTGCAGPRPCCSLKRLCTPERRSVPEMPGPWSTDVGGPRAHPFSSTGAARRAHRNLLAYPARALRGRGPRPARPFHDHGTFSRLLRLSRNL